MKTDNHRAQAIMELAIIFHMVCRERERRRGEQGEERKRGGKGRGGEEKESDAWQECRGEKRKRGIIFTITPGSPFQVKARGGGEGGATVLCTYRSGRIYSTSVRPAGACCCFVCPKCIWINLDVP